MPISPEKTENLCHSLKLMGDLLAPHDTLDGLLEEAARATLELLGVDHALVVWVKESPRSLWVRAKSSRPGVAESPELSNQVVAFLEAHQDSHSEGFGPSSELGQGSDNGTIIRRLEIKGESVGYLVVLLMPGSRPHFSGLLFSVIGEQIARTIEVHQIRQFLVSRYNALALIKDSTEAVGETQQLDGHILAALRNPDKVARLLAKSFYRDLRKAGFASDQILLVASEIIGNLTETIRKTRAKTDKESNPE